MNKGTACFKMHVLAQIQWAVLALDNLANKCMFPGNTSLAPAFNAYFLGILVTNCTFINKQQRMLSVTGKKQVILPPDSWVKRLRQDGTVALRLDRGSGAPQTVSHWIRELQQPKTFALSIMFWKARPDKMQADVWMDIILLCMGQMLSLGSFVAMCGELISCYLMGFL